MVAVLSAGFCLEGKQSRNWTTEKQTTSQKSACWKSQNPTFGNIVSTVFTPVLAKHSKALSLINCASAGVDRIQRNLEPLRK